MNTANLLGNSNTQNVFAQSLLADASLLGGNVSLGITTQQPLSPLYQIKQLMIQIDGV
jgi:hypothetical protein